MHEAVHKNTSYKAPNTLFQGSDPIDGIWVSFDLEIICASYLPFHADIGDHRPVMVDITMQTLLGTNLPRVVPVQAHRLNLKVEKIRDTYISKLEGLFKKNNVYERLKALKGKADYPVSNEVATASEGLNKQITELMLSAEKGCYKLFSGHYEFSLAVKSFLVRCHALRWLI